MLRPASLLCALALVLSVQPAAAMTNAELAAEVNAAIARCWNPPARASGSVTVQFELDQDGRIVGTPRVNGLASAGVAKSAIHAVQFCQPYRLPASMFSIWRHTSVRLSLGGGT